MSDARVCSKCGGSVQGAPRYRDRAGNTYCASCANGAVTRSSGVERPGPPSAPPGVPVHDPGYALADESSVVIPGRPAAPMLDADAGVPLEETVGEAPARVRAGSLGDFEVCVKCGAAMTRADQMCAGCGHKRGAELRPAGEGKKAAKARTCVKCGYDLTGLKTPRCPECGKVNLRSRSSVADEITRAEMRWAYLKPAIITAICLPIALVGIAFATGSAMAIPVFLGVYAVMLAVTFAVYFVCSVVWLGFDEPLSLVFVRLSAVNAITDVARAILFSLPVFWINQLLLGFVLVVAMMSIMEMETEDAAIVSVLIWGTRMGLGMVVMWYIVQLGWA